MKIKGFYTYCIEKIPDCHKTVNIIEEIRNCVGERPKIMVNLSTLKYHFNLKRKEMLVGIQFNKRKYIIENFFKKLVDAGAELIFVIKKNNATDEFLKKEYGYYMEGEKFLEKIEGTKNFNELMAMKKVVHKIPFHSFIELYLIQSAEKFGKIFVFNSFDKSRAIQMAQFANELNVKWILGTDSVQFFVPGDFKIWSDGALDINGMTVLEIDKNIIMKQFGIMNELVPFFIALGGKLETKSWIVRDISVYFKPPNPILKHKKSKTSVERIKLVRDFVLTIGLPITDYTYDLIRRRILGFNKSFFVEDMKAAVKKFTIEPNEWKNWNYFQKSSILVENKFFNFAEEIILNQKPIFVSPIFMTLDDTISSKMDNFYTIILPIIQKTAGVLLKYTNDKGPREITMLSKNEKRFHRYLITPILPDFDIPSLATLLSGEYSKIDKKKIASWIMDIELEKVDSVEDEYFVDFLILAYLCKKKVISIFGAACLLRTIIDSNDNNVIAHDNSEFPEKINKNGLHHSFLYTNMYIIVHSCLDSLGMKNFRPELKFDSAYFQKMYWMLFLNDHAEIDFDVMKLVPIIAKLI